MEERDVSEVLSLTTTVGSMADAEMLASTILERNLAACVQVEPGLVSHYRWKGKLCQEPEVRLVIKTLPVCLPALGVLFFEHHPYELPQFLAVPMRATEAYARWVRAEITAPSVPGSAP